MARQKQCGCLEPSASLLWLSPSLPTPVYTTRFRQSNKSDVGKKEILESFQFWAANMGYQMRVKKRVRTVRTGIPRTGVPRIASDAFRGAPLGYRCLWWTEAVSQR